MSNESTLDDSTLLDGDGFDMKAGIGPPPEHGVMFGDGEDGDEEIELDLDDLEEEDCDELVITP